MNGHGVNGFGGLLGKISSLESELQDTRKEYQSKQRTFGFIISIGRNMWLGKDGEFVYAVTMAQVFETEEEAKSVCDSIIIESYVTPLMAVPVDAFSGVHSDGESYRSWTDQAEIWVSKKRKSFLKSLQVDKKDKIRVGK